VHILVSSPDAPGGIARATTTLANTLAESYPVHVVGLKRLPSARRYPLDPEVRVTYISDPATAWTRWLLPAGAPTRLFDAARRGGNRGQWRTLIGDALLDAQPGSGEPPPIELTDAASGLRLRR
jgi:hypothetical protein